MGMHCEYKSNHCKLRKQEFEVAHFVVMTRFVLCVLLLALALDTCQGVKFIIKSLETKCLGEEVQANELMVGKFSVEPKSSDVQIKVYGPNAEVLQSRTGADAGKFAVTTTTNGDHQVCFSNTGSVDRDVSFNLEVGLTAKDYQAVAKKDNLKPLELELRRIEDVVTSIYESMEYLKTREEAMRNTNGMASGFFLPMLSNQFSIRVNEFSSFVLQYIVCPCSRWFGTLASFLPQRLLRIKEDDLSAEYEENVSNEVILYSCFTCQTPFQLVTDFFQTSLSTQRG
jgi:hypothetical protein